MNNKKKCLYIDRKKIDCNREIWFFENNLIVVCVWFWVFVLTRKKKPF